jgi:hypothetical protein
MRFSLSSFWQDEKTTAKSPQDEDLEVNHSPSTSFNNNGKNVFSTSSSSLTCKHNFCNEEIAFFFNCIFTFSLTKISSTVQRDSKGGIKHLIFEEPPTNFTKFPKVSAKTTKTSSSSSKQLSIILVKK